MDPYSYCYIVEHTFRPFTIQDTKPWFHKYTKITKSELAFLRKDQDIKQFIPAGRSNKCAYCGSHQDKAYRCIHCGAPMEEQLSRVTEKNLYGHSL